MRSSFLQARFLVLCAALVLSLPGNLHAQFSEFITRRVDTLMDGSQPFRFISLNTPNLHYIEDYLPFNGVNPWRLPDAFEIRDALTTIREIGGKVTRMYVLSVRRQNDSPSIIRHVEGPGRFDERAFRTLDTVLALANEIGVRVIIPFVDNWKWWGGPAEYAAFRGKESDEFWTDPVLIADIKKTIAFLITRRNTATGTLYRDDRGILAWETGNELGAPFSWTREIAAYVKSLDTNHLLIEGTRAPALTEEALNDPNIDIVSSHHYGDPRISIGYIVANQLAARGRKPYIIGEYGIVSTQDIRLITDVIIHEGIAGGMIWSLRFRTREGGFYHHYEYNNIAAYRWPGFRNGELYDEKIVLNIIRDRAYAIDGRSVPRLTAPAAPRLLPVTDVSAISWQGSVGAESYVVERRETDSTAWRVIAERVDESAVQYRPLFADQTAAPGTRYLYRVLAKNSSGVSEPSDSSAPVEVTMHTMVDDMGSFDNVFQKDGDLQLLQLEHIRQAKEDRTRMAGDNGSYIMYKLDAPVHAVRVDAFRSTESSVTVSADTSSAALQGLTLTTDVFRSIPNDYGFFEAISWSSDRIPARARYVKISFGEGIELARVEIRYGGATPDPPLRGRAEEEH